MMKWRSVAETSLFSRRADKLLSREERDELIDLLAVNPAAGDEIIGSGGVRKLRFGAGGRGKRGGFRVIYYWLVDDMPIIAIQIFGKNEQADLTLDEIRGAQAIVNIMKATLRASRKLN